MRQKTLRFYYLIKWLEMVILAMLTALIIHSGVKLIREHIRQAEQLNYYLLIFVPLTLLVALINLFYNTLLTNLRLLTKIHSTTWGLCVFDLFNKICCYKCCRKPCQDRCCSPWLIFKWFLTVVWVLLTIKVVRD